MERHNNNNSLFVYFLTQEPKGQLRGKREKINNNDDDDNITAYSGRSLLQSLAL
jgi:hypothetical protein